MPTIPEIRVSIENNLIKDDFFKNAQFLKDSRGRLITYTGGFSVVFPALVGGEKWAFRVWHADLGNLRTRFEKLSQAINNSHLPYLCDFSYVDEGIVVGGKIYPTTRMRWVEGKTIKDYICEHKNDKNLLIALCEKFLDVCQAMHSNNFAHGDLQHGNIIVNDVGEIFFVDYDSFYCPELKDLPDIISGLIDYQHPARSNNQLSGEKLDYFSELIIYLSILGIAENAQFVEDYKVADSERMLFSCDDFTNFKNSKIYSDLIALKNQKIDQLLQILETYLNCSSLDELEPFDVLWDNMNNKFELSVSKIKRNKEKAELSWNVKSAKEISLYANNIKISQCRNVDKIEVHPTETTTYRLEIIDKNGNVTNKELLLSVFDEAEILFESDKMFVLPTVPFTLKWTVKNAKSVELLGKNVGFEGNEFIKDGIEKETTYQLKIVDEFGEKSKFLIIRMLPMPIIKQVQAPLPAINTQIKINTNEPIVDEHLLENIKQQNLQIESLIEDLTKLNIHVETPAFSIETPELTSPNFSLSESFLGSFKNSCDELINNLKYNAKEMRDSLYSKIKEVITSKNLQ